MMKQIASGLIAAAFTVITVSEAHAWSRNRTVTGYRGTAQLSVSGSCVGYSCSRSVTRTGPYGNMASRNRSVVCDPASRSCASSSTTTGPNGGTIYREGGVHW
ncbi:MULTISPECIES: hypothetical protein [Alphaproteobacteria]|nr:MULTISPECIES: hypothetical protein [Alphaproteobacteria]